MKTRLVLGAAGGLLALFGVFRLLTQVQGQYLLRIAIWLVAALVLHDGVLSPVLGISGLVVDRLPGRGRRFVQGGLTAAGLVTAVALFFVLGSRNPRPVQKALLEQDFTRNLAILLGIVVAVAMLLYARRVVRDHRRSVTNARPADDQDSTVE